MNRSSFVLAAAAATLATRALPAAAADADFDLTTSTGTVFGTLLLPDAAGSGKLPAVLIVPGSGPVDRNGNGGGLKLDLYEKLAQALALKGVASVRYDKRGIGASAQGAPPEAELRFETYARDVEAWVRKMRADGRFSRIVIAGHSEGSLLGMLAAQTVHVEGFVSIEGAGSKAGDILAEQLHAQAAKYPQFIAPTDKILTALEAGSTVPEAEVPQQLYVLFRPSVQPYLISWFKYDPRVEIAKVTAPTVIIQGSHDVQVPVDDGRALSKADPKAKFVLIDGMTHVLTDDPGTTLAAQTTGAYADASRPLNATLVSTIAAVALPA